MKVPDCLGAEMENDQKTLINPTTKESFLGLTAHDLKAKGVTKKIAKTRINFVEAEAQRR